MNTHNNYTLGLKYLRWYIGICHSWLKPFVLLLLPGLYPLGLRVFHFQKCLPGKQIMKLNS